MKFSKNNMSTNTPMDTCEPFSEGILFGIKSIKDLRTMTRDKLKRSIHDFISHKRMEEQDKMANMNMKSYYVGSYRNPDLLQTLGAHYESLNIKEQAKTKFGGFHNVSQGPSKWSTLYEEPFMSGCCSPNSDNLSLETNRQVYRFIPKDSHENLEVMNK